MGLFSRNKGQQQQQSPSGRSPSPAPITLYEPVPTTPQPRPSTIHPPSGLSKASPQPDPSAPQFQQKLFHQTYNMLQQPQQAHGLWQPGIPGGVGPNTLVGALQPPYGPHQHDNSFPTAAAAATASGATATGNTAVAADGGITGASLLRQAVHAASREGKPLALNFIAQMQPIMANNPYGVSMPHQHPYGPPLQGHPGLAGGAPPPEGWRPGLVQNPYDAIRIPALPDMRDMPVELQDFRDQCATGVRQAVAMITAMEHQLGWERSRRQQAEEDCKVLLAAVRMERGVGDALLSAEERRRAEAAEAANKLTLAADELPQASEAATTIQKHVRGRLARKEFESHLRDILRGVDPSLDPAALPLAAQTHVSHVNTLGAPRRLGLRALLGEVVDKSWAAGGSGGDGTVSGPSTLPRDQPHEGATAYYRRQVDRIGQRLAGHRDAGQPHLGDASGDPLQADVKQLLSGSYPASSAQVIAALVRRCRELQAALLEAVGELQQAQLTIEGLKESNSKVSELSALHADLEAARQDNLRLVATVAKLRAAMGLQGPGGAGTGGGGAVAARENPYLAAWYRKAYADSEWQRMPPGGPGGVALLDGPDAAVETWGDLRASVPEPIMVPKVAVPGVHYRDLLSLKQDMGTSATQGPPDPLYTMPVPDSSSFVYERDTPLVPMQSAAPLIRESMPPDPYLLAPPLGIYHRRQQQSPHPFTPGGGGGATRSPYDAIYDNRGAVGNNSPRHTPSAAAYPPAPPPPGPSTASPPDLQQQQQQQQQHAVAAGALYQPQAAITGGSAGGGGGGDVAAGLFQYNRDTPVVPVYSVLPLIRENEFVRRSTSPQRDGTVLPTGAPPLLQQQPQSQLHHQPVAATGSLYSVQPPRGLSTNMPYIREPIQAPLSPVVSTEVAAAAAVTATLHSRQRNVAY